MCIQIIIQSLIFTCQVRLRVFARVFARFCARFCAPESNFKEEIRLAQLILHTNSENSVSISRKEKLKTENSLM